MKNENQEDEGVRKLRLLLTTNPDRFYTEKDLEDDEAILNRGLEVTYCMEALQRYLQGSEDKSIYVH